MVKTAIESALAGALARLSVAVEPGEVRLEHPADLAHGDYASGVALQCAKRTGLPPRELAEKIVAEAGSVPHVACVDIAGPGFINFRLDASTLADSIARARESARWGDGSVYEGKRIMIEYTQPNPFKPFHIGHLMSNAIGESLSRLIQAQGASVVRANYQGDVGLHVAKAIWGVMELQADPRNAEDLGRAYAFGASAYESDPAHKREIDAINKRVYAQSDPRINDIYAAGREASLQHFEELYAILGTRFDRYFFESETAPRGAEIVRAHPDIFPESDGARVFKGEESGLHTRVFLTSEGLATYEAKEIGLEYMKEEAYPGLDELIITTAVEQKEYFAVVKAALERLNPELAHKLAHISHGMMRFASGKMSSRKGNVVTGESLLTQLTALALGRATESRAADRDRLARDVAVSALKFQVLRSGTGRDIVFNEEQALSLEGDSGPYLQYTHARACALVEKAREQQVNIAVSETAEPNDTVRLAHRFPEIVERAALEREPHHLTGYVLALAGEFNAWYARERVLDGSPEEGHKVAIADSVRSTLARGLHLLGIPAPEKM